MPKSLLQIPHHKQLQGADCLAACAAMMLEYLGLGVPYRRIVQHLNITSLGTPHRNLLNLIGNVKHLQVRYQRGELNDLIEAIDLQIAPLVFVWTGDFPYWTSGAGHAVVVVGYDEEYFYVNDPAFDEAPQRVLHGDLELAWIAFDNFYAYFTRS